MTARELQSLLPMFRLRPTPLAALRLRLPAQKFTKRNLTSSPRTSSATTTPVTDKSRILEKPARFNPPSHGSRRARPTRNYPGPRMTEEQLEAQKSKSYPNMMPPEGSFMHSFLLSRRLHLVITLVRFPRVSLLSFNKTEEC